MKSIIIFIIVVAFAFNGVGQGCLFAEIKKSKIDALRPQASSGILGAMAEADRDTHLQADVRLSPDIAHLHFFWPGYADGNPENKILLSDKGSGLMRLALENMPVPPGFVIDSEITSDEIRTLSNDRASLRRAVGEIEKRMKALSGKERYFGDAKKPLFLSIRAGYPFVEPGKLSTLLNIGLNDETVKALEKRFEDKVELYNMYLMYLCFYSEAVLGVDIINTLDYDILEIYKNNFIRKYDNAHHFVGFELISKDGVPKKLVYKETISKLKKYLLDKHNIEFPEDPWQQLALAVEAFKKYQEGDMGDLSKQARLLHSKKMLGDSTYIAFTVQAMVFGNLNNNSCTGIAASRHPITGENSVYIEMAHKSQGPAVVTPSSGQVIFYKETFEKMFPAQLAAIKKNARKLETVYNDIRNIEFTIEGGKLYILQQRSALVHPVALVHYAIDMGINGTLTYREVADKISYSDIATRDILSIDYEESGSVLKESERIDHFISLLKSPVVSPNCDIEPVLRGFPLSPGVVTGRLIVRENPDRFLFDKYDNPIAAMGSSFFHSQIDMYWPVGFITKEDSLINHIAELAREKMGTADIIKPAVTLRAGANFARDDSGIVYTDNTGKPCRIENGDTITIDGNTGNIYLGKVPTISPIIAADTKLQRYFKIADALLAFYHGDEAGDIDTLNLDIKEDEDILNNDHLFQILLLTHGFIGSRDIVEPIVEKYIKGKNIKVSMCATCGKAYEVTEIKIPSNISHGWCAKHQIQWLEKAFPGKTIEPKWQEELTMQKAKEADYDARVKEYLSAHPEVLKALNGAVKASSSGSRDKTIQKIKGVVKELIEEGELPITRNIARKLGYEKTGSLTRLAKYHGIDLNLLGLFTSRDVFIYKVEGAVKELTDKGELPITRNVARKLGYDTAGPITKLANYYSIDLSLLGLVVFSRDKFIHKVAGAVKELIEEDKLPTICNVAYKLGYKESKELTRRSKYHKIDFSLLGVLSRRSVFIHELKGAVERLAVENIPIKNMNVARKLGYPNTSPVTRRANRNKVNLGFAISS